MVSHWKLSVVVEPVQVVMKEVAVVQNEVDCFEVAVVILNVENVEVV